MMTKEQKTAAEKDIEGIIELSQHPQYEKIVSKAHESNLGLLKGTRLVANSDEKGKKYIDWILLQSQYNFFVTHIAPNGCILLIKRPHLKSYLAIRYGYPGNNAAAVIGNKRTIQIENIGSLIKGEGYKMMKKIIALSRKMDVSIELWTETKKNVKYFERYGFVNHGMLGELGEFLMVFPKD